MAKILRRTMKKNHSFDDLRFEDFRDVADSLDTIVNEHNISEQNCMMIIMMVGAMHAVDALGKDLGLRTVRKMFEVAINHVTDAADNMNASRN